MDLDPREHIDYLSMIRQIGSEPVAEVSVGKSDIEQEAMFLFLWYYLHPGSPMAKEKNFDYRKEKAIELTENNSLPPNTVKEAIKSETDWFYHMMFFAFKSINDIAYEQWFTLRVDYMRTAAFLRQPPKSEKEMALQVKIRDGLSEQLKRLAEVEERFFEHAPSSDAIKKIATINISAGFVEEFAITTDEFSGRV